MTSNKKQYFYKDRVMQLFSEETIDIKTLFLFFLQRNRKNSAHFADNINKFGI